MEEQPLTPEQQELVVANLGFARGLARRRAASCWSMADDLEGAAYFGLVEAARSFDPALGYEFVTHAKTRIVGAMLDAQRDERPRGFRRAHERKLAPMPGTTSIECFADTEDVLHGYSRYLTLAELLPADEEPVGWEVEYHDELEGLARRALYGDIIPLIYGHAAHDPITAAAAALGKGSSLASKRHRQVLAALAERFGDPDEIFMMGHARHLNDVPSIPWGESIETKEAC